MFIVAAEHSFCGDIDGVPLGQRGVLPGPTQINRRASSGGKVVGCFTGPMLARARLDHAPKHYAISTHPQGQRLPVTLHWQSLRIPRALDMLT
ncbi:unnamed protein product [Pieris macdunnoughi]|uniref:Uncharacterized protein n=1 Tax=Pieris macdunnoughi TaxID=345717 RepID=A0A821STC9_9NEOP|nr:unnamed protein product [Pieris macdunnoughi]